MKSSLQRAIIVLLGIMIMVSCKKDRREELFELSHFIDFDIQPGLNTFDTHFFIVGPVPSSFEQRLEDSGHTRDKVKTIEAKDAVLSSTFGDVNLEFIHQISVYIFDPFNPDDKIEFFYLDPTPFRNSTSWRLFPGIADITEWVDQEYFGVEVRLNFRQNSPSLIPMRLEFDLRAMGE
ncbi:MAG: hypothetical protein ABIQ11_09735 [Saprospiraceae bacterium]